MNIKFLYVYNYWLLKLDPVCLLLFVGVETNILNILWI